MDQPLYAVAKQIQWNFPEKYGEKQFVIIFSGLHVEMAFLKAIGGRGRVVRGKWMDSCPK